MTLVEMMFEISGLLETFITGIRILTVITYLGLELGPNPSLLYDIGIDLFGPPVKTAPVWELGLVLISSTLLL